MIWFPFKKFGSMEFELSGEKVISVKIIDISYDISYFGFIGC